MPVLCESSVYPSGFALATTCAPTWPAAPAFVSTTTGCFRIGSIMLASGRVTMSLMPPGGNAFTIVIACEGKLSCANTGPVATMAVVPTTKLRRSIIFLRTLANGAIPVLLTLNAADRVNGRFDPLGVLLPEFRKSRRVEVGDFVANIGDGGLELLARDGLPNCVAHHFDGCCGRILWCKKYAHNSRQSGERRNSASRRGRAVQDRHRQYWRRSRLPRPGGFCEILGRGRQAGRIGRARDRPRSGLAGPGSPRLPESGGI